MAKSLKLAKRVTYIGNDGYQRAAVVTGTRESVQAGTSVKRPDEGHANLLVYKNGSTDTYAKTNVPQGTGPGTFQL